MKSETILKKLSSYLSRHDVERLRMNLVLKRSIVICLAIADISKHYNPGEEEERIVSDLLSQLCKNHFNSKP